MNGWIKLHRSVLDNEVYRKDPTAWRVFTHLLLSVDRETGCCTFGIKQLASNLKLKESTTYVAIQRLIQMKMISKRSNNQYSTFCICKWKEYQANDKNEMKTKSKPNENQVTHYKKKEIRSKNNTKVLGIYGNPDINRILETFENSFGMKPVRIQANRNAAQRILLKVKDIDKVCRIVEYAASIQGDKYSPSVGSLIDIEEKLIKLVAHSKSATGRMYDAG